MKLLLDTYVFLWFISGDRRLSPASVAAIRDPANAVFLSAASMWEIAIKHSIGKLSLPASPREYIPQQRERHGIQSLPVDEMSAAVLSELPGIHCDPFDRMLICQATHHSMTIVTQDRVFRSYPVALLDNT